MRIKGCSSQNSAWSRQIDRLIEHYRVNSRGIMARFKALRWDAQAGLVGIAHPHLPAVAGLDWL
ncbi:MAG: hypothetical protein ACOX0Q_03760 [Syntrophomonadaceae bacterium]